VVGLGRVGMACARAVLASEDLRLVGIVRRPESAARALPEELRGAVAVVTHASELGAVAGALVCVPAEQVRDTALALLAQSVPVVECAILHGPAFEAHREALDHAARRHRTAAIAGAGWDPGAMSLLRGLLALLTPRGETHVHHQTSGSLHHTLAARNVSGVKDALCTERTSAAGRPQRYVYVELEPGASAPEVESALRADPLFLDQETWVFAVASIAAMEHESGGLVLERRGFAATRGHQHFLWEARIDEAAVTAQVMLAAARALPGRRPGAHTLLDIAPAQLFGPRFPAQAPDWL
jgi:diaminopimelate dehydrogenase